MATFARPFDTIATILELRAQDRHDAARQRVRLGAECRRLPGDRPGQRAGTGDRSMTNGA